MLLGGVGSSFVGVGHEAEGSLCQMGLQMLPEDKGNAWGRHNQKGTDAIIACWFGWRGYDRELWLAIDETEAESDSKAESNSKRGDSNYGMLALEAMDKKKI